MKSLEDQLNEVLAESDRIAAELNRELFLIGRANAAIDYLRGVRQQTARRVELLMEQRGPKAISPPHAREPDAGAGDAFGPYDPQWPRRDGE